LFYRHWTTFTEFKRSHLFVVSAGADRKSGVSPDSAGGHPDRQSADQQAGSLPAESGKVPDLQPKDLTPGNHDVPPFSLGGQDMYAISPDGQEVAYTSNIDEVEATSTNDEIFIVPISGGTAKKISTSPGADTTPLYSPHGKYLAWRSQARAGFEADKWRLLVQDRETGTLEDSSAGLDRSVASFTWGPYETLFYTAESQGEAPIYVTAADEMIRKHVGEPFEFGRLYADDLIAIKQKLFFSRMSIKAPNEIWVANLPEEKDPIVLMAPGARRPYNATPVTHMNDALLSQIDMQPLESFTFKGANDEEVQGFMVKPPGFDPNKKYPLKFLIHGGPQGAWGNEWTYRWNAQLFAANGNYVVVMINFHGSTGYGQNFTDSISGDWGGAPYVDLMKGLDYVEKIYPFIDKNREAALGASYGGYMANWILGHTNRFKCIVSHDGMFNTESAYGTTEELWFPEWEFKGPPWKNREMYRKFTPHLFADKFKTPTLVIHGQNDYRLDVSEGFQLFTTLQRLGIPSKMLYFPDEGHWVMKPQNSRLWYKTVNDWVDQWCKR
jgi:dipeptidyl aminopeptidase/acylaminoacyl peptidase